MLKIERILCPIDFSEFSLKAYDYAYSLARQYEAKLFLQFVISPIGVAYPYAVLPDGAVAAIYCDLTAQAEKRLAEIAKRQPLDNFQPEYVVHKGVVPETILTFAEEQSINLIVMGTHGRRGWDRLMTGSVTERVLRRAQCPVLAVRSPEHDFVDPKEPRDAVRLRKILFCTDFSENSSQAFEYALSLAEEYQAELTALHVLDEYDATDLPGKSQEIEHKLREPIPPEALDWCTVKTAIRVGKPYHEIVQLARETQTDLIVLGVRGRGAVDIAVFGSTTYRVIQLGPCPVLAVHAELSE